MKNLERLERVLREMTDGPLTVVYGKAPFDTYQICTALGATLASTTHYGGMREDAIGIVALRNLADKLVAVVKASTLEPIFHGDSPLKSSLADLDDAIAKELPE